MIYSSLIKIDELFVIVQPKWVLSVILFYFYQINYIFKILFYNSLAF